ncbi:uncharacterized protein LOC128956717 [Oppia nitens]|uniref:uncharacterized protein LOC128956717 n=1 Tax=Oppia nitens TaxID=1686743 RepID=UPI0023DAD121|nr:uncharacterized protein LOC128956717 [Oppia nitens]
MIKLIFTIIVLLNYLYLAESSDCKPAANKCKKLFELEADGGTFKEWAIKKCPTDKTIIPQSEVDEYKKCVTTHLEPCLKTELLKNVFINLLSKFDLTKVCTEAEQSKVQKWVMDIIENHTNELEKDDENQCSILRQALTNVKNCAHF